MSGFSRLNSLSCKILLTVISKVVSVSKAGLVLKIKLVIRVCSGIVSANFLHAISNSSSVNDLFWITFGSTFEIIDIDTEEIFVYTLVGGYESEPSKGTISYNSPLAKAFIGKRKDDEIKLTLNGNEVYYEIREIYFDKELFNNKDI